MKIQTTTVTPLTDKSSRVDLVFADNADEAAAKTFIRVRCSVEHMPNSSLAAFQTRALTHALELLDAESERCREIAGLRSRNEV